MDIEAILKSLASKRPIFRHESDLQSALAEEISTNHRQIVVEREVRMNPTSARVDLLARHNGQSTFFELKYKTRALNLEHGGDVFDLKDHLAQDQGEYDYLRDLERLESLVEATNNSSGYAIMLTNDPRYWTPGRMANPIDRDFRLFDGRKMSRRLAWGERAGSGSIKGREAAIQLRGDYFIRWSHFSELNAPGKSTFRYLCLQVAPLPGQGQTHETTRGM